MQLSKRALKLIEEAKNLYVDSEKITPLDGRFVYYDGNIRENGSDKHYKFNSRGIDSFHYDEENDTLGNWGRGMGLIYRKGEWAQPADRIIPKIEEKQFSYQIY